MLTAFQPFLGRACNQSAQVFEHLLQTNFLPANCESQLLAVDRSQLEAMVKTRLAGAASSTPARTGPRLKYWLALGEAGPDGVALLETLATNAFDLGKDPASAGAGPVCGILQPQAPPTLVAHWPAQGLWKHLRGKGHAVELSCDAGRHCCNGLLFEATYAAQSMRPRPWIGFLHLPRRPEDLSQQVDLVAASLAWLDQQFL